MAYNTPRTWVNGELVTASLLNQDIRDNMDAVNTTATSAQTVANQGHRILTTTQKNALTGVATGTMVYDSDLKAPFIWTGNAWNILSSTMVAPTVVTNGSSASNTSGLVAFSNVSTLSLNNCFTAAYDTYNVYVRITASSSAAVVGALRASGTDITAYTGELLQASGTSTTAFTSGTWSNISVMGLNYVGYFNMVVYSPYQNVPTMIQSSLGSSTPALQFGGWRTNASGVHDGFSLFMSTGTNFSGDIRVVGVA